MPRPIRNLSDMEIDEVSLVDKGANQHAMITIAKRATEEDAMPDLYSEDGTLVDENALADGDIVFDAEGNAYQFEAGEEVEEQPEQQEEPVSVGKSAFGTRQSASATTSFSDQVREELAKAYTDADRDAVITKAFGRIDELEKQQQQAFEVAKAERDLRLTREYIAKAADYNLPVNPNELGPVLYRMTEAMSYEDCAVIAKCLETAGDALFQEIGYQGGGDNADVMSMVEQKAVEVGKSATAENITAVFDTSPEAYDEYLRAQRGNF